MWLSNSLTVVAMCYTFARLINEELSLPPESEYFRPPPPVWVDVVPVPRLVEDHPVVMAPPHIVALFADDLAPSPPLEDPLSPGGHGAGGPSPAQGPTPQVGRGRAGLRAFIRTLRNPGRSRD